MGLGYRARVLRVLDTESGSWIQSQGLTGLVNRVRFWIKSQGLGYRVRVLDKVRVLNK